ncbi:MAG: grhN [Mycobacteriales bacterium]
MRVRSRPPPVWLMRHVVNPVMCGLLRSPLSRLVPSAVLLEFRGRRTGAAYRVPVLGHEVAGTVAVFTPACWRHNFSGGAPVTVRRRGQTHLCRGELITEPGIVGPALRAVLVAGGSPMRLGLTIPAGHEPSDAEFAAVRSMIRLDG